MITTKGIRILSLTKDSILELISEEDIFRRYIDNNFELGEVFNSPLGDDSNPSFAVYYNKRANEVLFNDFRHGGGDFVQFVRKTHNNCSYFDALRIINRDLDLKLGTNRSISNLPEIIKRERVYRKKEIKVYTQLFTEVDLEYWNSYGINENTLKFYNIYSTYRYSVDNITKRYYSTNYPIYTYYFPRTGNKKIYIPNEEKFNKWRGNANNEQDIQGYDQLPKNGELIIITKSMKDCMTLCSLGYSAVAPHAEGHNINKDFIRHISGRFNRVVILYDNDQAGLFNAEKISKMFNLEFVYIPLEYGAKDISDFYKNNNKEKSLKLLKELI